MDMSNMEFKNVVGRLFPLRADPKILQGFVDKYLNREDYDHGCYFLAYPSFVFLQVLNYGSMSIKGATNFRETQREVLFAIPLLWFEQNDHGAYEFHGRRYRLDSGKSATVTPFLFVDDRGSLWGGREIFGWPKALMQVESDISAWMTSPLKERKLLSVYGYLLERESEDERPSYRPILEISQRVDSSLHVERKGRVQLPDWIDNVQQSVELMADSFTELMHLWRHLASQAVPWASRFDVQLQGGRRAGGGPTTYAIGIKQFRQADDPAEACYMSLGYSKSTVTRFNGGGLLGSLEQMRRLSGGYTIRIHEYDSKPIVRTLGLKLQAIEECDGHPVGVIQPVLPLWLDLDSSYGGAETLFAVAHGERLDVNTPVDDLPAFESEYTYMLKDEPGTTGRGVHGRGASG